QVHVVCQNTEQLCFSNLWVLYFSSEMADFSTTVITIELIHFLLGAIGCWFQPQLVFNSYSVLINGGNGASHSYLFNWSYLNRDMEAVQVFTAFYTMIVMLLCHYLYVRFCCKSAPAQAAAIKYQTMLHFNFIVFYGVLQF